MQRKPIILIFTSSDERGGLSQMLKDAIQNKGVYNAVILDEFAYFRKKPCKVLGFLEKSFIGDFYEKTKKALLSKKKNGATALLKKERRIKNAVLRFNPEYILTITPFAQNSVTETKIKTNFKTPVVYMYPYLTADKSIINDATDYYLLENQELKEMMVENYLSPKKAVVLGLPYSVSKLEREELTALKQEFGLPKTKTVLLNTDKKFDCENLLSLLIDQGDIINIAVNCKNGDISDFGSIMSKAKGMTIQFVSEGNFDKYISVSDILITECDVSVIYKAFGVRLPVISFANNQQEENDLDYLASKGLVLKANDHLDIVGLLYKILQTDEKQKLQDAGEKFVEISSLDNIADYLTSFTEFSREEDNGEN